MPEAGEVVHQVFCLRSTSGTIGCRISVRKKPRRRPNPRRVKRMQVWRGVTASVAALAFVAGTAWATGGQTRAAAKAAAAEEAPPDKSLGSRNAPIVLEV